MHGCAQLRPQRQAERITGGGYSGSGSWVVEFYTEIQDRENIERLEKHRIQVEGPYLGGGVGGPGTS